LLFAAATTGSALIDLVGPGCPSLCPRTIMSPETQFGPYFATGQPFGPPLYDRRRPDRPIDDARERAELEAIEHQRAQRHPEREQFPGGAWWAMPRPHAGKGPKNYRRSDERILDECCCRMQDDDYLDASDIECRVEDGEVTLTGTVSDRWQKRRAEDCCEIVAGVHDVHNQLRVPRPERGAAGDRTSARGASPRREEASRRS
jgi:hypothetical protein